MTQPVPDTCSVPHPQAARNARLNARRRQETIARRERDMGVAGPRTSRALPITSEIREEVRRIVRDLDGGPCDTDLIRMAIGLLHGDSTGPYYGDPRLGSSRRRTLARNFSQSWKESTGLSWRIRPTKKLQRIEPNIRRVEVFSTIYCESPPRVSFEARSRFGGLGLVARSFCSLDAARGWLRAARQAHAEGKDPREVVTMFYKWGELEALGRVQAA